MPRQARSRATFGAILEAAEQVLRRDGLERLTATAVAERAGVSVGSLYQYFPNKESIVGLVAERRVARVHRVLVRILAQNRGVSPFETIESLLTGLHAHLCADVPTFRELMKTDVFCASSTAMRRCLESLIGLFLRCAQGQPEAFPVDGGQLELSVGIVSRVAWETCRETLVHDSEAFVRPKFCEELAEIAHELLLQRAWPDRNANGSKPAHRLEAGQCLRPARPSPCAASGPASPSTLRLGLSPSAQEGFAELAQPVSR